MSDCSATRTWPRSRLVLTSVSPLHPSSAARILERCDALARCSEQADGLTRVYLSPQQEAANALVLSWMRDAGMHARLDAAGNVVGRYEGERPGLPCLMLGSHLDTVRDAGKYDGMLGVVICSAMNAACTGCGFPLVSRPSSVTISLPIEFATVNWHDRTA